MLNHLADIDSVLRALADPTRRQIVEQLGSGPATVTALAARRQMSLPGVLQHLQVLEQSGLVVSTKEGRVRTCRLEPDRLEGVERWVADRRKSWERRLDRLGTYLDNDTKTDTKGKP